MSTGVDWFEAVDGLGERYNIAATIFKNHGCCGQNFAAIDAASALRPDMTPEQIARIEIGTYGVALDVPNRPPAATPFEGRFSTPFTVVSALVHSGVRVNGFTPERLSDDRVQALTERVQMHVDPECDAAFPGQHLAALAIEIVDGRRLSHHQPTRKGDPDAPLTDSDLDAEFEELAAPAVGAAGRETSSRCSGQPRR